MKRGRPRGLTLNPAAVEDLLHATDTTKAALCAAAGISSSQMADALSDKLRKGLQRDVIDRMAAALGCRPSTIAPEIGDGYDLGPRYVAVRQSDRECDLTVASWLTTVAPLAVA